MTIKKTENENELTMTLEGWLDTQAAPELKNELDNIGENITSMVIDIEKLEYVSSAGIRQLVAICKKMQGKLVIRNSSVELMDIFHTTGVDRIIRFE